MGSFNTACFASQQTISPNEDARIIFLIQSRSYSPVDLTFGDATHKAYGVASSTCYAEAFWQPVGVFLEATYEDYGKFSIKKTPHTRAALAHIIGRLLESGLNASECENSSHDIPFNLASKLTECSAAFQASVQPRKFDAAAPVYFTEEFDSDLDLIWAYVEEVLSENRVFMMDYSHVVRPVALGVLCESAYHGLIKAKETEYSYRGEPNDMDSYVKRAVSELEERLATLKKDDDGFHKSWLISDGLRSMTERISRSMRQSTCFISDFVDAAVAEKLTTAELIEKVLPSIKPALQDMFAVGGLEEFNVRFSPMVYAGQDYSNELGKAYAKFVQEVSTQVSRVNLVRCYGEFAVYQFEVSAEFDSAALQDECRERDFALFVLSKEDLGGKWLITAEATIDNVAELLEYMPEVAKDILIIDTLKTV